jgi:hypothetical protein
VFSLANSELEVLVLDPVADRDRMGTRYCSGGYIFQITDAAVGELLTGPTYPHSFNAFDGQGIPDSFARGPLRDPKSPSRAIVTGIGICDLAADAVVEPSEWAVDANGLSGHSPHIAMSTQHELASFALTLRRGVELVGRTVRSRVYVKNTGKVGFQICWFPHPFFPHPVGDELCRINAPVSVTEGAGYKLSGSGFIVRDNWQPGGTTTLLSSMMPALAPSFCSDSRRWVSLRGRARMPLGSSRSGATKTRSRGSRTLRTRLRSVRS